MAVIRTPYQSISEATAGSGGGGTSLNPTGLVSTVTTLLPMMTGPTTSTVFYSGFGTIFDNTSGVLDSTKGWAFEILDVRVSHGSNGRRTAVQLFTGAGRMFVFSRNVQTIKELSFVPTTYAPTPGISNLEQCPTIQEESGLYRFAWAGIAQASSSSFYNQAANVTVKLTVRPVFQGDTIGDVPTPQTYLSVENVHRAF